MQQEQSWRYPTPVPMPSPNMVRLEPRPTPSIPDLRGRHRRLAEIKRVEQESLLLEEELRKLDEAERASAICKEVLLTIERQPDPLLPITRGPEESTWNRWFDGPGPGESQPCCCCPR